MKERPNERPDASADEVIRLLRISDEKLAEKLGSVNRTRERCSWDAALTLCNDYYASCSARITTSVDCCQAVILAHRGAVYQAMGLMDRAKKSYEDSHSLFSFGACGDGDSSWNEGVACYGLGLVAQSCRDWRLAQQHLEEALEKFEAAGTKIPASDKRFAIAATQQRLAMAEALREADERTPAKQPLKRNGKEDQELTVPLIGRTVAGEPILAMELSSNGDLPSKLVLNNRLHKVIPLVKGGKLPSGQAVDGKLFALSITGTSMLNAKIEDGDYVVFRCQQDAAPGEIVVVRIDNIDDSYSTVKRFYYQDDTVILKADSPDYPHWERRFTRHDPTVVILGKAIAVAKANDKSLPTQAPW